MELYIFSSSERKQRVISVVKLINFQDICQTSHLQNIADLVFCNFRYLEN